MILVYKIFGVVVVQGVFIVELIYIVVVLVLNIYMIGVVVSGVCILGQLMVLFNLNFGEIYYGIGIYGEFGYWCEFF